MIFIKESRFLFCPLSSSFLLAFSFSGSLKDQTRIPTASGAVHNPKYINYFHSQNHPFLYIRNMISFNSEDIQFNLKNKTKLKNWIVSTIENPPRSSGSFRAGKKAGDISFVFCSDAFLLEMNKKYLNHDTYTDIITFDYSKDDSNNNTRFSLLDSAPSDKSEVTARESKSKGTKTNSPISGDIFISIDRVQENAGKFSPIDSAQGGKQRKKSSNFEDELHRVIIHGVLHLLGYKDKTKIAKAEMRKQENLCLKVFNRK